jgi:hypothetical protein
MFTEFIPCLTMTENIYKASETSRAISLISDTFDCVQRAELRVSNYDLRWDGELCQKVSPF